MNYEVRCTCGKAHTVTGADAGASIPCTCGKRVDIPPLHQLRASAGQQVLSPILRLQTLLLEGRLPGTRACACCAQDTDGLIRARVQCLWAAVTPGGRSRGDTIGGCLVSGFLLSTGSGLLFLATRASAPSKEHGQDVAFIAPLPVCEACRPQLDDPAALRQALRAIPEYADLLQRYPHARVTRVW